MRSFRSCSARIAWIGGQAAGGGMMTSPVWCVTCAMADLGHAPHSPFAKAASSSAMAASDIGTIAPSGAAVDHRLGRRLQHFQAVEGVQDARPADLHAVVLQQQDRVAERGQARQLAAVAELHAEGDAPHLPQEQVALGDRARVQRRVGDAERRGVDRVGGDDRPDLGVGRVDRPVVDRGGAGWLAWLRGRRGGPARGPARPASLRSTRWGVIRNDSASRRAEKSPWVLIISRCR